MNQTNYFNYGIWFLATVKSSKSDVLRFNPSSGRMTNSTNYWWWPIYESNSINKTSHLSCYIPYRFFKNLPSPLTTCKNEKNLKINQKLDLFICYSNWVMYRVSNNRGLEYIGIKLLHTLCLNSWRRDFFSQKQLSLKLHFVISPSSEEQRFVKFPVAKWK